MTGERRAKKPADYGRQRHRPETRWFYRGPKQHIFGSPSPNTVQLQEHSCDGRIVKVLDLF
jgi:hypothetical protein